MRVLIKIETDYSLMYIYGTDIPVFLKFHNHFFMQLCNFINSHSFIFADSRLSVVTTDKSKHPRP